MSRVLAPGGVFGLDLVPDVPRWQEFAPREPARHARSAWRAGDADRIRASGPRSRPDHLRPGVRRRHRPRAPHASLLADISRTVGIQPLRRRLERAGFRIDAVLGSYDGAPWDPRADVWVILASNIWTRRRISRDFQSSLRTRAGLVS